MRNRRSSRLAQLAARFRVPKAGAVFLGAMLAAIFSGARISAAQTLLYSYGFDNASGSTVAPSQQASAGDGTLSITNVGTATAAFNGTGVSGQPGDLAYNTYNASGSTNTATYGSTTNYNLLSSAALNSAPTNNQLSVTMWIQAPQGLSSTAGDANRLLEINSGSSDGSPVYFSLNAGQAGYAGSNYAHLQVEINGSNPDTTTTDNTTPGFSNTGNVTTQQLGTGTGWYFVAFTFDGTAATNNLNFYNGTTSSSAALLGVGNLPGATIGNLSGDTIQVDNRPAGSREFLGLTDDVHIFAGLLALNQLQYVQSQDEADSLIGTLPATPEPASLGLLAFGALPLLRRRRKQSV